MYQNFVRVMFIEIHNINNFYKYLENSLELLVHANLANLSISSLACKQL